MDHCDVHGAQMMKHADLTMVIPLTLPLPPASQIFPLIPDFSFSTIMGLIFVILSCLEKYWTDYHEIWYSQFLVDFSSTDIIMSNLNL